MHPNVNKILFESADKKCESKCSLYRNVNAIVHQIFVLQCSFYAQFKQNWIDKNCSLTLDLLFYTSQKVLQCSIQNYGHITSQNCPSMFHQKFSKIWALYQKKALYSDSLDSESNPSSFYLLGYILLVVCIAVMREAKILAFLQSKGWTP